METEKIEEESVSNIEDAQIGEKKERNYLKPKPVKVIDYTFENRQGNDCLVIECKHPDSKDNIKISGIKLKRFNKLKQQGLWIGTDEDGNLPHDSGVAELLRVAKVNTIKELKEKTIATDILSIDNPMLLFKGY